MYEQNQIDKARTIMEGIVGTYPKRLDLWNVYLDKEIKLARQGRELETVRQLFERLLSMGFSPKKMKFLFKKYLTFEQQVGNEKTIQHVKELAQNFVQQAIVS